MRRIFFINSKPTWGASNIWKITCGFGLVKKNYYSESVLLSCGTGKKTWITEAFSF